MKGEYIISENINFSQINGFVEDYKNTLESRNRSDFYNIKIIFQIDRNSDEENGLIDPLFLSYLSLFIKDFPNSTIKFILKDKLTEKRSFSLAIQLEHFIATFNLKEKLILDGSYLVKETGEIRKIYFRNSLTHSQKFIPPVYINNTKESISIYFNSDKKPKEGIFFDLIQDYNNKIIELINYWGFEKNERNTDISNQFINKLNLVDLSFIETTLYLLLINKNTYLTLRGEGITEKLRIKRKKENLKRFSHYIKYVKEIAKGLRELATNIQEHSEHLGVITARIFDKASLIKLKENSIHDFLNSDFKHHYISNKEKGEMFFLDINVIDFGAKSISKKYLENLEENKKHTTLTEINTSMIDSDMSIIKNKFKYKDFFLIGEHFFQLEHQQNKLISRYGLHHFTNIICGELNGFVKTSSQGEGCVFYNNFFSNETVYMNSPPRGTSYNCIIPLQIDFKEKRQIEEEKTYKYQNTNNINTLLELDKYIIKWLDDSSISSNEKTIIYKFPNKKHIELFNVTNQLEIIDNDKYRYIFELYDIIKSENKHFQDCILLIDSSKLYALDESNWIRLLSALNKIYKDIIIYNITNENFLKIKYLRERLETAINYNTKIKNQFYKKFSFWFENSRVIFYSKKTRNKGLKNDFRYGASVLAGTNIKQYNYINKSVWGHHYSFKAGDGFFSNLEKDLEEPNDSIYGQQFFNNKNLKYFELIINIEEDNNTKISLLEKSIQYSLNTEYKNKSDTNNRGYKISNTHFRLGSKIHISTFYYAKRLFHNSFFTTPISYLLYKDIFKTLESHKNYTLIGYDKYSDFLLSSIRNLLDQKIKSLNKPVKINHCTISKQGVLSRDPKSLFENTIIIVPIASTFSTSLKIKKDLDGIIGRYNEQKIQDIKYLISQLEGFNYREDSINRKLNINCFSEQNNTISFLKKFEKKFLNYGEKNKEIIKNIKASILHLKNTQNPVQFLNIILVGHKKRKGITSYDYEYFDDKDVQIETFDNGFLNTYNWEEIIRTKKAIPVRSYDELDKTILPPQKYYIPLYTEWKKAEDCDLCFPKNLQDEKCLIETGKASVTPQLIFGLPKVKQANSLGLNKLNLKGAILYGNLYRKRSKYLYYIKTGSVINHETSNKKNIEAWIKGDLKETLYDKIKDFNDKKIVIVTPATGSKSNFLDLINEHLFNYTANCVFISLEEDYIENAESLYSDALEGAEIIFYVDDILLSIKAFLEVDYIVKYIRKKQQTGYGIDFCITLINRMTYDSEDNLLLKLEPIHGKKVISIRDRLFYFTKLNSPPIEDPNNQFPLNKERKRYKTLSDISSLDSVRQEFYSNRTRITPVNLSDLSNKKYNEKKIDDSVYYRNRKLYQLLVLDAFYSLFDENLNKFSNENKQQYESLEQLQNDIEDKLKKEHKEHKKILGKYRDNLPYVIIKVMCTAPLVYYKTIREKALQWIIEKLEIQLHKIKLFDKNHINDDFLDFISTEGDNNFSEFHNLKFLLKRSVQLKSNYIIRKSFFETIEILITTLHKNSDKLQDQIKNSNKKNPTLFEKKYTKKVTSKKLIIYLVSLVQELVLNHETKSIKLEKNLNRFLKTTNPISDEFKTENGTFIHYLRLLKLENTEIAHKFWEQIKKDEEKKDEEKITAVNLLKEYSQHPKYKLLTKYLLPKNSIAEFQAFIDIKIAINDFKVLKREEKIDLFIKNYILKNMHIILGGDNVVVETYFIINFKNKKKKIEREDLYEFKGVNTKKSIIDNNYLNSLTKQMFEGINAEIKDGTSQLSNFEIFSGETNENSNQLYFRKDVLEADTIRKSFEYKNIQGNIKSVLLIRISDFDINNVSNNLYTQAVFVFFLNRKDKIVEEKLRLLLLLRKSISKFLKKDISANTFLELVKFKERDDYFKTNHHQFGQYFNNQDRLARKLLKNSTQNNTLINIFKEFEITTNALRGQTSSFEAIDKKLYFSLSDIEKLIKIIFQSESLGGGSFYMDTYNICFDQLYNENEFEIPKIIVNSIIPQLVINMKQYTHDESNQIEIRFEVCLKERNIKMTFKNRIHLKYIIKREETKHKNPQKGKKMCENYIKELQKTDPNFTITFPKDNVLSYTNKDWYTVSINIPYEK